MKRKEAKFNNLNYQSVGRIDIKELKELTEKSRRNKFRLCLHKKTSDLVQEMIICTKTLFILNLTNIPIIKVSLII